MAYRRKDAFYARAKSAGYRSRAAYKLLELAQRYRLIAAGDRVVDLGAWPGSWLQVATELSGEKGVVIGVDLVPVDPVRGATLITGDVRSEEISAEILRRSGRRVDVLLSDMAPKLTGIAATDEARSAECVEGALRIAEAVLRPGGRALIKVFSGAGTRALLQRLRARFQEVHLTRPKASRSGSAEHYVVALGFRAASAAR